MNMKLLGYCFSDQTVSTHPFSPAAVVYISRMTALIEMPYFFKTIGKIFLQPVFKNNADLSVQSYDGITGTPGTVFFGCFENTRHRLLVYTRDHRCTHDTDRNANG